MPSVQSGDTGYLQRGARNCQEDEVKSKAVAQGSGSLLVANLALHQADVFFCRGKDISIISINILNTVNTVIIADTGAQLLRYSGLYYTSTVQAAQFGHVVPHL